MSNISSTKKIMHIIFVCSRYPLVVIMIVVLSIFLAMSYDFPPADNTIIRGVDYNNLSIVNEKRLEKQEIEIKFLYEYLKMINMRMSSIEGRPEINLERGVIYNSDGEILIEEYENKSNKKKPDKKEIN